MQNEAQRDRILETAHEKFRRFGIRRVTMDEIARDLRVSKKTLYQFFPDKEALVRASVERIAGKVIPIVSEAFGRDGPPMERLVAAWQGFATLPRLLSAELIADIQADYPHLWKEIDARRHEVIGRFEKLIADGVRSGDIRPEVHPKVAMRLIVAVVEQVMVPDVLASGEFTPAEAVGTIITIVSRGMCAGAPPVFAEQRP
jgi:AcrR family transcriptional regulator